MFAFVRFSGSQINSAFQIHYQCLSTKLATPGGSTTIVGCGLKEAIKKKGDIEKEKTKKFIADFGTERLTHVTLKDIYNGMRGVPLMLCKTSSVDPMKGLMYRDYTIPDIREKLPKATNSNEPLPEGLFWLLCTGSIPTAQQVKALSAEWAERSELPTCLVKILKSFPSDMHPMTQFAIACAALNHNSVFVKAYNGRVDKDKYWEYLYEQGMDLIAKLPSIAAFIYRYNYCKTDKIVAASKDNDWSANFARKLSWEDPLFKEFMRLYMCLHADHGSGNVSTHATLLTSSALVDPSLSFTAGLCGLAGPLHGLATERSLVWLRDMQRKYGTTPTDKQIEDFTRETIKAGHVIPGYGHTVLRQTDPRFTCQYEFAQKNFPNDDLCKLTAQVFKVVPPVLKSLGKVSNPYPNVDGHSGAILWAFGLTATEFYTVLFGVARGLGAMAQSIWARVIDLPIERPDSLTPKELLKAVEGKKGKVTVKLCNPRVSKSMLASTVGPLSDTPKHGSTPTVGTVRVDGSTPTDSSSDPKPDAPKYAFQSSFIPNTTGTLPSAPPTSSPNYPGTPFIIKVVQPSFNLTSGTKSSGPSTAGRTSPGKPSPVASGLQSNARKSITRSISRKSYYKKRRNISRNKLVHCNCVDCRKRKRITRRRALKVKNVAGKKKCNKLCKERKGKPRQI